MCGSVQRGRIRPLWIVSVLRPLTAYAACPRNLRFFPALRAVLLQLGDGRQGVVVGEFPEIVPDEDRHGNLVKDPRRGVLGIPGGDQGENGCDTKVWP